MIQGNTWHEYSNDLKLFLCDVAQSMGGFRFGNLAEVRYFLKQLGRNEISI